MKYATLCSGIEAVSVAVQPLGWQPAYFSEIDKFCCELLEQKYPDTPNRGDLNEWETWSRRERSDIIIAGTPCQSFSGAGKQAGFDDQRGQLTLQFLRMVRRTKPEWVVWENVPRILSIDGGRTFGTILRTLAQCGYSLAYRVLDAQYFGVPQQRRRVFIVGHLGDWRYPGAVLFEPESLRGNNQTRGKKRKKVAGALTRRLGSGGCDDNTAQAGHLIAHSLTSRYDSSEDGTGRGLPLIVNAEGGDGCLTKSNLSKGVNNQTPLVIAPLDRRKTKRRHDMGAGCGIGEIGDPAYTVTESYQHGIIGNTGVRRFTPLECERLMGFPDNYTAIIRANGKPAADSPRYKALGNSMAVPVMRWILERIDLVLKP